MDEINKVVKQTVTPELFRKEYERVFDDNERWNAIETTDEALYKWDEESTYIQNPPFFENMSVEPGVVEPLKGLRVVGKFGDSVTTDHISGGSHRQGYTLLESTCRKKAFLQEISTHMVHAEATMKS